MCIRDRQEEIGIMKLIGATDFFVRAPFVIEGILLGIVGAAIPMGILYVLYNKVIEFVMTRFHLLSGFLQFLDVSHVFQMCIRDRHAALQIGSTFGSAHQGNGGSGACAQG